MYTYKHGLVLVWWLECSTVCYLIATCEGPVESHVVFQGLPTQQQKIQAIASQNKKLATSGRNRTDTNRLEASYAIHYITEAWLRRSDTRRIRTDKAMKAT